MKLFDVIGSQSDSISYSIGAEGWMYKFLARFCVVCFLRILPIASRWWSWTDKVTLKYV